MLFRKSFIRALSFVVCLSMASAARAQTYAYVVGQRPEAPPGGNGAQTVTVIDTRTNAIVKTITIGDGCICLSPDMIAASPDGSRVYVTNEMGNSVSVINTLTNAVVDTIAVGRRPVAVATSPDGTRVYIVNGEGSRIAKESDGNYIKPGVPSVSVLNTAINAVIATIPLPDGKARGVAIQPDGRRLFVSNLDTIDVIDTATNQIVTVMKDRAGDVLLGLASGGNGVSGANVTSNTVSSFAIPPYVFSFGRPVVASPHTVRFQPGYPYQMFVPGQGGVTTSGGVTGPMTLPISGALSVAFTPSGEKAYVTTDSGVTIVTAVTTPIIGGATNIVTGSIPFDAVTNGAPMGIVIARVSLTPRDFDEDRKSDLVVYRPSDGTWYLLSSSFGYNVANYSAFQWGLPDDIPILGDFDGDRQADLIAYRPSTGVWYIRYSSLGYSYAGYAEFQWGLPNDIPLAADFDGDGKTDLTVYRPSTGTWYIRYSSKGYRVADYAEFQWGLTGDIPVVGDFDGDGRTDLVAYRPTENHRWFIRFSSRDYSTSSYRVFQWGLDGDEAIPADFDGDYKTDLAIYRPSTGEWWIRYSMFGANPPGRGVYQWGLPGDIPTLADFDGDGKTDLTMYRPSTGEWLIRYSSQSYSVGAYGVYQWGMPDDVVVR